MADSTRRAARPGAHRFATSCRPWPPLAPPPTNSLRWPASGTRARSCAITACGSRSIGSGVRDELKSIHHLEERPPCQALSLHVRRARLEHEGARPAGVLEDADGSVPQLAVRLEPPGPELQVRQDGWTEAVTPEEALCATVEHSQWCPASGADGAGAIASTARRRSAPFASATTARGSSHSKRHGAPELARTTAHHSAGLNEAAHTLRLRSPWSNHLN